MRLHRPRPRRLHAGAGPRRGCGRHGGRHSFPSGHTSACFAGAEFLDRRYGHAWGIPYFALATFVGYSRVESRNHYVHDCVAGAALGFGAARLATTPRGVALEVRRSW